MAVLQVRGVRKTFHAEEAPVRALRGVDLTVDHGEFVAIIGPSGCGKSTLLNLIAGLDAPSGGEVVLGSDSLSGKDESALARLRREHIGFVFQFFNLLDGMTAFENVALPALIAGMRRPQAERRARDLLDLLGLAGKAREFPALAVGRPAAATRHRPSARERADARARGRADGGARLGRRRRDSRAVPPFARIAGRRSCS